jgi:rare lipoprotein A
MQSADGYSEEGIASWYGMKFQGRRTSNGELFDVYQATAAHKSLPLPSYLRVTNLENDASMIVRVNDRGPFVDDRLIDVSYGVAVKLGFAEQGTARVRLEHIPVDGKDDWRGTQESNYRQLQVGAYQQRSSAERVAREIQAMLSDDITVQVSSVTHEKGNHFSCSGGACGEFGETQRTSGTSHKKRALRRAAITLSGSALELVH